MPAPAGIIDKKRVGWPKGVDEGFIANPKWKKVVVVVLRDL
jgi:hypothetical protein